MTKEVDVESKLGRFRIDMPIHLGRHMRTDERIKCYGFLEEICHQAIHSSYRIACDSINRTYHRDLDQSQIPLMSFSSIVTSEGKKIRNILSQEAVSILQRYDFNPDGSWPEDRPFPSEIKNKPMEWVTISPAAIMKACNLPEPSPITYAEGEYSKPEEGYHPRYNGRRGGRIMYEDEDRPKVLTDYVVYINSKEDRDPLQTILHDDSIEKHTGQVVSIFIDGDLVGKQSEERIKGGKAESEEKKEYVKHIDIRVETDEGGRYNITSTDIDDAFRQLLALLLESKMITRYQQFYTDGEKLLKTTIDKYFKYWHHRTLLDEYHVNEKIDTLTSMGIETRRVPSPWEKPILYVRGENKGKIRSQPMTSLSRVYASRIKSAIYYGNIDEAINYIRHISPDDTQSLKKLEELIEYFEYRRDMIPCYALRKKAGLKNSSNSSELCNELLVSGRQKVDERMHWGEDGSAALASLTAIFVNRAEKRWFSKRQVKFEMYYVNPTKTHSSTKWTIS